MTTDFERLDAWRAGDTAAGSELLRRHFDALLRFFFSKAADHEVEDLIQKTMLACVEGRERFGKRASFRTFMFSVARNILATHYRRRAVREPVDLSVASIADLAASPASVEVAREEQQLLLQALRRLPADQQLMLELHYWEGLDAAELAEIFEVDPTTIRTRLHRARLKLKDTIDRLTRFPSLRDQALEGLETWARNLHRAHGGGGDQPPGT